MVDALTPFNALSAAARELGSQAELARVCNLSPTAVWKWFQGSKPLPPEYVLRVEAATGISRHALRPDIYPIESGAGGTDSPPALSPPPPPSAGGALSSVLSPAEEHSPAHQFHAPLRPETPHLESGTDDLGAEPGERA